MILEYKEYGRTDRIFDEVSAENDDDLLISLLFIDIERL